MRPSAKIPSLPRASSCGPRQRKWPVFFLKKSLPRATRRPSAKNAHKKFSINFFAEGYGEDPRQKPNLWRGLWSRPSAKRQEILFLICFLHSIDINISYIYISTITYVYHAQSNFSQYITTIIMKPQIIISQPYYKSQHVHHHSHVYYNKFIKSNAIIQQVQLQPPSLLYVQ